jgi:hypothetical protein
MRLLRDTDEHLIFKSGTGGVFVRMVSIVLRHVFAKSVCHSLVHFFLVEDCLRFNGLKHI